jgi:membrane-bound serine protease (ClpP class)
MISLRRDAVKRATTGRRASRQARAGRMRLCSAGSMSDALQRFRPLRKPPGPRGTGRSLRRALTILALGGLPAAATPGELVHLRLDSIVHPVARERVVEALAEADAAGASAFVLELSTPGGLLTSTREISTAMLGAKTPVIVWVAPAGAQAASAGFFLLLSGEFAAMAPGTNTGAAHPVGGQGESLAGDVARKAEQDAAATIRTLASRRGRDAALAEKAVLESRSFTEREALAAGLVDVVAADLPALVAALDGRAYEKASGRGTLALGGAIVREIRPSAVQRLLSAIAHPNIAYLLLSLGMLGIYFELAHPGAILPGVVGGIALLLGLFALSVLPVSYAGVGLILLAIVFFIAEIKVTSFGLLAVGGIISLVLGSVMLFRSAEPALRVSRGLIFTTAFCAAAVVGFLALLAARVQGTKVRTGVEGLVGERGRAVATLAPAGRVFVHGELWNAESEGGEIAAGAEVEVVAVEGLRLRVKSGERRS